MAIITSQIPPQSFELIRDKIGEILALELAAQYALNNTLPNPTIWVERFIPFDSYVEIPAINVNTESGEWSGKTLIKVDGYYGYNIDIYTNAVGAVNTPADKKAMLDMQRLAGLIRAILSAPAYVTLGFAAGMVGGVMVEGFMIADKNQVKDALSDVIGRVKVKVRAIEQNIITDTAVPIDRATTTIFLNESEKGFFYDFDPVQ